MIRSAPLPRLPSPARSAAADAATARSLLARLDGSSEPCDLSAGYARRILREATCWPTLRVAAAVNRLGCEDF